jgi:hypothetical protein
MTYTINGKPYTEFDINERCAEIMEHKTVNYCRSAHYTLPIIDKCWDELMEWVEHSGESATGMSEFVDMYGVKWEYLIEKHNCSKLVAACICLIELNE